MVVKIQVLGLNKAKKFVSTKLKQGVALAAKGTEIAGFHVQNKVKSSIAGREAEPASVDTGRFLNSVDINVAGQATEVFTNIPYAKFLEFGTSKIQARHHFQNTANREKSAVKQIIQAEVNKL